MTTTFSRAAAVACMAAFLASCSGGNGSLPKANAPGAGDAHAATHKAKVAIRIKVPRKHGRKGRRDRYVSASTQSMKLVFSNANAQLTNEVLVVDLTPSSTGCTSTLTSVLCVLLVPLAPGTGYDATVTTYDQTAAEGNVLSSGQDVGFSVVAGASNEIDMTLSGIPSQLVVLPASAASTTNAQGGIDLIGTAKRPLIVEALDADGNIILGAGSPTFSISQTTGSLNLTVTQPFTSNPVAPNTFYLKPPANYTSSTATIQVQASYAGQAFDGCAGNAACTANVTIDMAEVFAVANASSVDVLELGQPAAVVTVSTGITQVDGIAFDSSGNLYVSNCGTGCGHTASDSVLVYAPPYAGVTPFAITQGSVSAVAVPQGIAFDSNGRLYVANDASLVAGTDNVAIYTPPFSANSTASSAITTGVDVPGALALDSSNDLFVANLQGNGGDGSVSGYASNYSSGAPTYGPIVTQVQDPVAIAVDQTENLYVADKTANEVTKYFGPLAVANGNAPYTCSACGNGLPANPVAVTACNSCSNFTPVSLAALTSGGSSSGYAFFAADLQNGAVYEYTNAATPAYSATINANMNAPVAIGLDQQAIPNLYVANNGGNSVTGYSGSNAYAFMNSLASGFSAPISIAVAQ